MGRIVVLGGGAGGAVVATRLSKMLSDELSAGKWEIVLIDKNPNHEFRPSYLWVAMGIRKPGDVSRPLSLLESKGVKFINDKVLRIDPEKQTVETEKNGSVDWDFLVISLGAVLRPEQVPGIENTFHPWELADAQKLRDALAGFDGGKVVIGPVKPIYRCSPAPFELAFLIKYLAEQRNIPVDITVIHPWQEPMQPFGPFMVRAFRTFLDMFGVKFEGGWETEKVGAGKIYSKDGRELDWDLAIVIPPHEPAEPVAQNEKLKNPQNGWMLVDKKTLRHPEYDNIWAIGDIISPTIGIGMAGVFAHFQGDYVATQIADRIKGTFFGMTYNKTGLCVMDIGYMGAAVFCDFTDVIDGKAQFPRCWMLGGMKAFRGAKVAFERMWFGQLFGK